MSKKVQVKREIHLNILNYTVSISSFLNSFQYFSHVHSAIRNCNDYESLLYYKMFTSLQLFQKIKIQTHILYCIIKATNQNYTRRDEFVSTAYYT